MALFESRQFSVKSAYQLLIATNEGEGAAMAEASSGAPDVRWTELWGLNLPPKVRFFLWRATKNILPIAGELFRRHINADPSCGSCRNELETISHVLVHCRGLRYLWSSAPFQITPVANHESFWSLYQKWKTSLSKEMFLVALVICWKVWDIRNKEIHGVEEGFTGDLVVWASEYLESYQRAQISRPLTYIAPATNI